MLNIATIASSAKAFTLFNQWDKVIYKESVCQASDFSPTFISTI